MARPSSKEHVVAVALEAFREKGFANVSLRDLAESAGLTKAALFYHFPAKADLLAEIAAPLLSAMDEALESLEATRPRPDALSVLTRYLDALLDAREICAFLFSEMAAVRDQGLAKEFAARRMRFENLLTKGAHSQASRVRAECAIGLLQEAARRFDLSRAATKKAVLAAALGAAGG